MISSFKRSIFFEKFVTTIKITSQRAQTFLSFLMPGKNQIKQRSTKNQQNQNDTSAAATTQPAQPAKSGKFGDIVVRLLSAALLVSVQILLIVSGPIAIGIEIIIIQFSAFYEFIRIIIDKSKESLVSQYIKIMPYLLAFITSYLTIAPFFLKTFVPYSDITAILLDYHNIICYGAGACVLVLFVINLNPKNDFYALTRLAWSILGSILLIASSNMYTYVANFSLFWFFTSISLIIWNDSFAYFCGRLFGRHQLIALSPKKTVEGFVGALIFTVIIGWFTPLLFAKYPYAYCSDIKPFNFSMKCQVPKEFIRRNYDFFGTIIEAYPAQLHSLVLAIFASLVAPFGGFLASALKRAYGLKDFGKLIPGHGGVLDRCDCQFVMATFSYLYISTFVRN